MNRRLNDRLQKHVEAFEQIGQTTCEIRRRHIFARWNAFCVGQLAQTVNGARYEIIERIHCRLEIDVENVVKVNQDLTEVDGDVHAN